MPRWGNQRTAFAIDNRFLSTTISRKKLSFFLAGCLLRLFQVFPNYPELSTEPVAKAG
jgi:hypothetical protein